MLWISLVFASGSALWLVHKFNFSKWLWIPPIVVLLLTLVDENSDVHVMLDAKVETAAESSMEFIARLGGWREELHGKAPGGVIPKMDLASSVLREGDLQVVHSIVTKQPGHDRCGVDHLSFWDRLGVDLSSAVYDKDYAEDWLDQILAPLQVKIKQLPAFSAMPLHCTDQSYVCWQFMPIGATNAALLVRFGDMVAVSHRGTRWTSVRDMLGALQTRLVPSDAGAHVHQGWSSVSDLKRLSQVVELWSVNATQAISAGHSKGGALAALFAQVLQKQTDGLFWHSRSFSSPKWTCNHDEDAKNLESRVLSSINYYIEYDPVYVGFEMMGFQAQLPNTSEHVVKRPNDLGSLGALYWTFRAHFLSSVADHVFEEPITVHPFRAALEKGIVRGVGLLTFGFGVVLCTIARLNGFGGRAKRI